MYLDEWLFLYYMMNNSSCTTYGIVWSSMSLHLRQAISDEACQHFSPCRCPYPLSYMYARGCRSWRSFGCKPVSYRVRGTRVYFVHLMILREYLQTQFNQAKIVFLCCPKPKSKDACLLLLAWYSQWLVRWRAALVLSSSWLLWVTFARFQISFWYLPCCPL